MAERRPRRKQPPGTKGTRTRRSTAHTTPGATSSGTTPTKRDQLLRNAVIAEPLIDPKQRAALQLEEDAYGRLPIMVELNLRHESGLPGAQTRFLELYRQLATAPSKPKPSTPLPIANTYFRCDLTLDEVIELVQRDAGDADAKPDGKKRAIYRVWPDFSIEALIYRSVTTVKADAAQRSFAASGQGITWAVIDSGINAEHPHFTTYNTLGGDVAKLHKDFTIPEEEPSTDEGREHLTDEERKRLDEARERSVGSALTDQLGHGTHVAGIIAGGLGVVENGFPNRLVKDKQATFRVLEHVSRGAVDPNESHTNSDVFDRTAEIEEGDQFSGVAPRCKLISLKVLGANSRGSSSNVIRALQYVREKLNGNGKMQIVHGVNISLGYEFDAKWFACGQSPICVEVDRLVRSGVVVVVAAGNTGYGALSAAERQTRTGFQVTINDPGNAAWAITVGATHRDMPHTYGVSYFSSKGPTGDGRLKPDLVAPGERITSCAAGRVLAALSDGADPPKEAAVYTDDSGTSMAAPHVSGAIAAFLSIRREFIGRPEEVKRLFLETATSLGRERYFEGHGLLDLMRTIQAV